MKVYAVPLHLSYIAFILQVCKNVFMFSVGLPFLRGIPLQEIGNFI